MALFELPTGKLATITNIVGTDEIVLRLKTMGFFNGRFIEMIHPSTHNSIVNIGGSKVGLSKEILERIEVELI